MLGSGALLVGAPAGMALADTHTHVNGDTHRESTKSSAASTTSSTAAPKLAVANGRNADENRDLATLLTAIQTKAATDPGLAKLLSKVPPSLLAKLACVQTASCK